MSRMFIGNALIVLLFCLFLFARLSYTTEIQKYSFASRGENPQLINYLIILLIIFFAISSFTKISAIEPDVFVQSTVNRAAETLGGSLSKQDRIDELKKIANDTVDIRGIGFYSLGSHRKNMSDAQKKEYEKVFSDYFLVSFSSRLAEYTNPEIEVKNKQFLNDNYTIVNSILIATDDRPEVKIDWRVYTKNPDNPLIRDLII